jgi:hypothetical protein
MSTGKLILLFFKVKIYDFLHQIQIIFYLYKKLKFAYLDILFCFIYLFFNPYRISKKFLKKRGEKKIYEYGETPLMSFIKIIDRCSLTSSDIFLELGAGRGLNCFWLAINYKCSVACVEWIPFFANIAIFLKNHLKLLNLKILNADMLNVDIKDASCVYIFHTSLAVRLVERLKELKKGSRVITISHPLTYYENSGYEIKETVKVSFPWGVSYAYIHERK